MTTEVCDDDAIRTLIIAIHTPGVRRAMGTDVAPAQGCWSGRVEHVVSGQAARFGSLGGCLGFTAGVLVHVQAIRMTPSPKTILLRDAPCM